MARKSTISRLPAEIKSYIEAMLATGAQTLDELIADLRERFPAEAGAGTLPSRSALGRYGQKLDRRLAAVKAATEAARLISEQAGDDKDVRSEGLTSLVQTELIDAIFALQEAEEVPEGMTANEAAAARVDLLSKAARNIATLTRSSVSLKKFQAEVKAKADAAAATVDKLVRDGGLTGEAGAALRAQIMGIVR